MLYILELTSVAKSHAKICVVVFKSCIVSTLVTFYLATNLKEPEVWRFELMLKPKKKKRVLETFFVGTFITCDFKFSATQIQERKSTVWEIFFFGKWE